MIGKQARQRFFQRDGMRRRRGEYHRDGAECAPNAFATLSQQSFPRRPDASKVMRFALGYNMSD